MPPKKKKKKKKKKTTRLGMVRWQMVGRGLEQKEPNWRLKWAFSSLLARLSVGIVKTRQVKIRHDTTRHDTTRHDTTRHDKPSQAKTWHDKTWQLQDNYRATTSQAKPIQDVTRQDNYNTRLDLKNSEGGICAGVFMGMPKRLLIDLPRDINRFPQEILIDLSRD